MRQITTPYDRFYENLEKKNTRTGNHFFPSTTHVLDHGKTPEQLKTWYKNLGHYAADYMNHRANVGSLVHNLVEMMVKNKETIDEAMIVAYFKTMSGYRLKETDILFAKRSLDGFIQWYEEMKKDYKDFKILDCEYQTCGDDYAGTIDLKVFFDKKTVIVDLKTSKSIMETHELQVEAYRRSDGADLGATLKLGSERRNSTRYKFAVVKTAAKQERLWEKFCAIKTLYYLDNPEAGPTYEEFPDEFKI